jgi:hypothetical protein
MSNQLGSDLSYSTHPARRYLMLRYWQRIPLEVVAHEASVRLHLPGFENRNKLDAESYLKDLLIGARSGPGSFQVIAGQAASSRLFGPATSKGYDPLAWLDGETPSSLTNEDYLRRNKLSEYDINKESGKRRVNAAVVMWSHPQINAFVRAMLLAGKKCAAIAANLNQQWPLFLGSVARPIDVESFQDLFWDFMGWPVRQQLNFALLYGTSADVSALQSGERGALFHLGIQSTQPVTLEQLQCDELAQLRVFRDVAFGRAEHYRLRPESFDAKVFSATWSTWKDAQARIVELETERNKVDLSDQGGLDQVKAADFDSYEQILLAAEQGGVEVLVDRVYSAGGIAQQEYEALRQSVSSGTFDYQTETTLREWLTAWEQAEQDKRIKQAQGSRAKDISAHQTKGRKGKTAFDKDRHQDEKAAEPDLAKPGPNQGVTAPRPATAPSNHATSEQAPAIGVPTGIPDPLGPKASQSSDVLGRQGEAKKDSKDNQDLGFLFKKLG